MEGCEDWPKENNLKRQSQKRQGQHSLTVQATITKTQLNLLYHEGTAMDFIFASGRALLQ